MQATIKMFVKTPWLLCIVMQLVNQHQTSTGQECGKMPLMVNSCLWLMGVMSLAISREAQMEHIAVQLTMVLVILLIALWK